MGPPPGAAATFPQRGGFDAEERLVEDSFPRTARVASAGNPVRVSRGLAGTTLWRPNQLRGVHKAPTPTKQSFANPIGSSIHTLQGSVGNEHNPNCRAESRLPA